jgi:hypothetical protein
MSKKATSSNKTSTRRKSAATGQYAVRKTTTVARHPRTTITERNADSGHEAPVLGAAENVSFPNAALIGSFAPVPLPDDPDDDIIERLAAEAEAGIPQEKLRRRGRPSIGDDASSSYSVRLPIDLVTLTDERSAMDGVSRGETIRRALIEYLTQ